MKKPVIILTLCILFILIIVAFLMLTKHEQQQIIIYNMHEHIESFEQGQKFLDVMDITGISTAVLVGSPDATIYGRSGFDGHDANNKEILKLASNYPGKFIAFCTLDPRDPDKLDKFKDCIAKGSKGLKLYSGHYAQFYKIIGPINRTDMYEVYSYCQEHKIPIIFHVNPGAEQLQQEFEQILIDFPQLKIICPHFCLSSINITRFEYLMDTYPSLYTDISFGFFAKDGFERLSANTSKYIPVMEKYQDRIFFGTDMVVTSHKRKTTEWIANLTMCYRDLLEKEQYTCNVGQEINAELNGLALDENILKKIYQQNPERFFEETDHNT